MQDREKTARAIRAERIEVAAVEGGRGLLRTSSQLGTGVERIAVQIAVCSIGLSKII